ncbi:general transcription factor 3C polypeptide 6 [Pectinophora gossypiella]|uniref:general transcription factor 3C polypeptide 6 n=1 Tax=Pectinophora gossypiella TaxID=13191 RepID=UPI00214F355A|nr:general transcription factor 3C polypeptide 6 [Pectinophora gossypiella]
MNSKVQEYSYSEEEILVYAEFDDSVNIDKYRSIHVLGINEREPIIQADDTFFKGKFVNPLGTHMFFEENLLAKSEDPLFDKLPEKNLMYVFKTNKSLNMEHAYLIPREGAGQNIKGEAEVPDELPTVKFASMEEALTAFKHILKQDDNASIDADVVTQLATTTVSTPTKSIETTPHTPVVSNQIENESDVAMQT